MTGLEHEWPDPDRRETALLRLAARMHSQSERDHLTPAETLVLEALSHGLGTKGAADVLGYTFEGVKGLSKSGRRALRAKNTTHACSEAIRRGLIR